MNPELLSIRVILYMAIILSSFVLLERFLKEAGVILAIILTIIIFTDLFKRILKFEPKR